MTIGVKVLHVEDDDLSSAMIARHLERANDYRFEVLRAVSESEALELFAQGDVGLVLLDYHLEQGDGLSLLKRLREEDEIVPIVVLSGVATPEVAARLLAAGADDYVGKRGFSPEEFLKSVREALVRAERVRKRARLDPVEIRLRFEQRFRALCAEYAALVGDRFLVRLERLEHEARAAKLTEEEVGTMIEALGRRLDPLAIRPVVLEVWQRAFRGRRPPEGPISEGFVDAPPKNRDNGANDS